jgi:hypothetical protein
MTAQKMLTEIGDSEKKEAEKYQRKTKSEPLCPFHPTCSGSIMGRLLPDVTRLL